MSNLYVTATEFANHPTGLNLQNLIPNGTPGQQTAELQVLCAKISGYVESITFQPLYAQLVTETQQVRADYAGRLVVQPRRFPVQAVTAAQWATGTNGGWTSVPLDSTQVVTPVGGGFPRRWYADDIDYRCLSGWGRPALTVMFQYVAGWANGLLTSPCAAGATSIDVDDATGMVGPLTTGAITAPGTQLVLYDLAGQETVTVASVQGTTVTLEAPTQYAHVAGVRASAVPDAVTNAAIYLLAWEIKERRAGGGVVMAGQLQAMQPSENEDVRIARRNLLPYRRVI